jgi:nucleoside-diphosphate-sugar epimerase
MNVLITGATGFIGRHLVNELTGRGVRCRLLVRPGTSAESYEGRDDIEIRRGDITEPQTLTGIADGVGVVYHLAAQLGNWGVPDTEFRATNIDGTKNLLAESAKAKAHQFIFCSTPGVQGLGHRLAKESFAYDPRGIYEATKCEAEKVVMEHGSKGGPSVTVVRPDFVYGPGDTRRLPLYRRIRDRKMYLIGSGACVIRPTYVSDVVGALLLVRGNQNAFGQIYNIAGPELVTVRRFLDTAAQCLGVKMPRITVPLWCARTMAVIDEMVSSVLGREPFITRSKVQFLTVDHGTDISRAEQIIGYVPGCQLIDGIAATVSWYTENGFL